MSFVTFGPGQLNDPALRLYRSACVNSNEELHESNMVSGRPETEKRTDNVRVPPRKPGNRRLLETTSFQCVKVMTPVNEWRRLLAYRT